MKSIIGWSLGQGKNARVMGVEDHDLWDSTELSRPLSAGAHDAAGGLLTLQSHSLHAAFGVLWYLTHVEPNRDSLDSNMSFLNLRDVLPHKLYFMHWQP